MFICQKPDSLLIGTKNSYWESIKPDTVFTVCVTLLIFLLGLYINRRYDKYKEDKRLDELENYFYALTKLLSNPVEKLADEFRNFSKQLRDRKSRDFTFTVRSGIDFLRNLRNISHSDTYKIFVTRKSGMMQKKAELFYDLFRHIYMIEFIVGRYQIEFEFVTSEYRKKHQEWNSSINEIQRFFDDMLSNAKRNNITRQQDPFLSGFDDILAGWISVDDFRQMYVAVDNYVLKFKELCKTFSSDPRAIILLRPTLDCLRIYDDTEKLKNLYASHFEDCADKIIEAKNKIEPVS